MTLPPTEEEIVAHFREQAVFCGGLGSAFMEHLCEVMADDIEAGGPVAALVAGWPTNPRRDALSLRIAGYLHHSVLTGAAKIWLRPIRRATNHGRWQGSGRWRGTGCRVRVPGAGCS